MFKYKNAMISMAVVAMLAACGGGGGGSNNGNGDGDGVTPPTGGGTVISDTNLSGTTVALSEPAILVPEGTTAIPVPYAAFNSDQVRAAGEDDAGFYGTFTGTPYSDASPLRFIGVRVLDGADDPATDDSKPGRLVFQLQDNNAVAEGQRENLSIEIDNITTARTAGEITVSLGEGAQVHVSARNSANQSSGVVSIPAASIANLITVVDDEGTNDIILNVDAVVTAAAAAAPAGNAKAVLDSVATFNSTKEQPFVVSMTLTNVDFATAAGTATTGASNVKVGDRDTVSGEGGVTGYVQSVRTVPEAPAAGGVE